MNDDLNNPNIRFKEFDFDWRKVRKDQQMKFPKLSDLTIMQTPKTTRCCYLCMGKKFNQINHTSGKVTVKTCAACQGQGVLHN